ncbi:hypothetical protein QEN19_003239 [Hanseniaspora menglaensis]
MICLLADLPPVRMLPETIILELITILEPEPTLNFAQQISKLKPISQESFTWFKSKWPIEIFTSCADLGEFSALLNSISTNETPEKIITYLTLLLSHQAVFSKEETVNKITSIISKYCGSSTASDTVRLFQLTADSEPIKIVEKGITNDLIGLKTWGASLPFSKRLIKDESIFSQIKNLKKTSGNEQIYNILELGSGTGLAGITILRKLENYDNFKLYLTDLPEIVTNLKENLALNHPNNKKFSVLPLDWKDHSSFIQAVGDVTFDFVVVCDCLYAPEHPGLVVNTINQFLTKETGELMLELPLRPRFEEERNNLWQLLKDNGYTRTEKEKDHGFDDFGESSYVFEKYKKC